MWFRVEVASSAFEDARGLEISILRALESFGKGGAGVLRSYSRNETICNQRSTLPLKGQTAAFRFLTRLGSSWGSGLCAWGSCGNSSLAVTNYACVPYYRTFK